MISGELIAIAATAPLWLTAVAALLWLKYG